MSNYSMPKFVQKTLLEDGYTDVQFFMTSQPLLTWYVKDPDTTYLSYILGYNKTNQISFSNY